MRRRRVVEGGSVVWAAAGAAVALTALPNVNSDAVVLVAFASVILPACALGAALALRCHHDRLAGSLLIVSVATPTYFAYPLNLPALIVGVALLAAPAVTLAEHRHTPAAAP